MRHLTTWASCLLLGAAACLPVSVFAQEFPTKPVRIVVPFTAGGGADLLARAIAERLSQKWNQPVLVDNKPGAGTIIGTQFVAKAAPDGYTLLLTSDATITTNPFVYAKLPYDPAKELAPVTGLVSFPQMIVAHPSVAANNMTELVALARSNPDKLNYSSYGNGSGPHLVFEGIATQTGARFTHVPFQGIAPAIQAVISGQVQLTLAGAFARPYLQEGKVKALATTGARRDPLLPNTPTLAEAGLSAADPAQWFGLFTTAGVPPSALKAIHAAVEEVFAHPEFADKWVKSRGWESAIMSPEQFTLFLKDDLASKSRLIKNAGIKPQ